MLRCAGSPGANSRDSCCCGVIKLGTAASCVWRTGRHSAIQCLTTPCAPMILPGHHERRRAVQQVPLRTWAELPVVEVKHQRDACGLVQPHEVCDGVAAGSVVVLHRQPRLHSTARVCTGSQPLSSAAAAGYMSTTQAAAQTLFTRWWSTFKLGLRVLKLAAKRSIVACLSPATEPQPYSQATYPHSLEAMQLRCCATLTTDPGQAQ